METIWLIIQSLDWSSIVLGLILAAISGIAIFVRKRRKHIKAWLEARKERAKHIREMPMNLAEATRSFQTLVEANGRTTMQFTTINEQLSLQAVTLESQNRVLADISAMGYGQMELDLVPRFVCDEQGRNRYVNTAYARLVGVGRDELDSFGYQRFISPTLNPGYMAGFHEASAQHRAYESEATIQRPNGTRCLVKIRVVPHPEDVPPATHWNGMLVYLREMPNAP